jgi:hypothetical protein
MMIQMRDHAERPQETAGGSPAMGCEEFQEQLPVLMGSDIREHEHLRSCLRCNELLDELEYIRDIAKGLLPSYEPSDKVWDNITRSIHETDEGEDRSNGFLSKSKL